MLKQKWLLIACLLQFVLIGAMFISAYLPVYFGTEVKVIAKGYDPRDLLAGHYVRLNYGIESKEEYPKHTEVFVSLQKINENYNIFTFGEVFTKKPKNKLYIKGETQSYSNLIHLKGIEKYFTTQENAQKLEKLLTQPNQEAIVTLKILDGKARITKLEVKVTEYKPYIESKP